LHVLNNVNIIAFNGDVARERTAQLLALAEKQGDKLMLMRGHAGMGVVLVYTGNFTESLLHYDQVLALYDPVEHRPLAMRFVQDLRVGALNTGALALWALGYPESALARTEQALGEAREIGHAGALMVAMSLTCITELMSRDYTAA